MEVLRKKVRQILEEGIGNTEDWTLFSDFGTTVLDTIEYAGDYNEVLNFVRKTLESEGWQFDDWTKQI